MKKFILLFVLAFPLLLFGQDRGGEVVTFKFECPWIYDADTPISINTDTELPFGTTSFIELAPENVLGFKYDFYDKDKRTNTCGKSEAVVFDKPIDGVPSYKISITSSNPNVKFLDSINPKNIECYVESVTSPSIASHINFKKVNKIQMPKLSEWTKDITISITIKDLGNDVNFDGTEDFIAPETGTLKDPDLVKTWIIKKISHPCPTELLHISTNTCLMEDTWYNTWNNPLLCFYQCGKVISPPRPNYEGIGIEEMFSTGTALGFTMSDLKPAFLALFPDVDTPDKVIPHILGGILTTVSTGTFVIYNAQSMNLRDMISDQYSGFGSTGPFLKTAFEDADGVGWEQEQSYKCYNDVIRKNILSTRMIKQTSSNGTVTTKLERKFKKI